MSNDILWIIFLVIGFGLFLILRAVMLWYWKIPEHLENQKKTIDLLTKIESNTRSIAPPQEAPPRPVPHTTPLMPRR